MHEEAYVTLLSSQWDCSFLVLVSYIDPRELQKGKGRVEKGDTGKETY